VGVVYSILMREVFVMRVDGKSKPAGHQGWIWMSLLSGVILLGAFESTAVRAESSESAYQLEIDQWHAERIERLKDKYGWLSLVGLMPLHEGENRFGSAADNDLVFPGKAPRQAGVITLAEGTARLKIGEGNTITSDGRPIESEIIFSQAGENTTVLDMGSFRFFVIERTGRYYLRVKDSEAEPLKNFKGIDRFPVREKWRITARFEQYNPPKKLMIPNVLGGEYEETCPGVAVFDVDGRTYRLEPTGSTKGGLFFVFADLTSGKETYGGGRFLSVDSCDSSGKVVLDFNKAYNPPCVFTPYATCPLPHEANILDLRIEAGEKKCAGAGH
jgi:uncharacterized protein (DUF1684 family)